MNNFESVYNIILSKYPVIRYNPHVFITEETIGGTNGGTVIQLPKYYKTESEFTMIHQKLKFYQCTHCKQYGCLILHGYLKGHSDVNQNTILRGHRIYCSNRRVQGKNGCGHTVSVMLWYIIKHFRITADTLWKFLDHIINGWNRLRAFDCNPFHNSSVYRIYQRFKCNQTRIRTLLLRIEKPPDNPSIKNPVTATIIHLKSIFKTHPICHFQYYFQTKII